VGEEVSEPTMGSPSGPTSNASGASIQAASIRDRPAEHDFLIFKLKLTLSGKIEYLDPHSPEGQKYMKSIKVSDEPMSTRPVRPEPQL